MPVTTTYRVAIQLRSDWLEPGLLIEASSPEEAAELAKEVAFRKGLEIAVEREPVEEVAAEYFNEDWGVHLKYFYWPIGQSRFNPKSNLS
jgi:hypothetical protein